jgi:hypothetical protein
LISEYESLTVDVDEIENSLIIVFFSLVLLRFSIFFLNEEDSRELLDLILADYALLSVLDKPK